MRRSSLAIGLAAVVVFPIAAIAAGPAPKGPATAASASSASGAKSAAPSASTATSTAPSTAATATTDVTLPIETDGNDTHLAESSPAPPPPPPPTPAGGPRASWHPDYAMEIEPHLVVAGLDKFGPGLGLGAHIAIPVWKHFPIRTIDDDISLGVGVDVVRYAAYKPRDPIGDSVSTTATYVPVFAQWNLWLGARASLFVQPQLLFRFAHYNDECSTHCAPTERVLPSGAIGLRFRIVNRVSFTVVVGWPLVTIGGSWL